MPQNILCVDDDESVRTVLKYILTAKGYLICMARDGKEALAVAAFAPLDVIITDHQMPQMTGLELVRKLRATAYRGKIIVFSGAMTTVARKEYETLRVNAILEKGRGTGELLALLKAP